VEALRRSEDRFRRIIEASPLPIVLIRDAKLIYCNSAYCALIGAEGPEKITGTPLLDLVPPEKKDEMISYIAAVSRDLQSFESVGMKTDGTRFHYEAHLSRIVLDDGPVTMVYVRDISDRVKAKTESEKIQAQLIQAQKMEAVGTLAGGLAHDFNNMLGGIIGSLDLLELLLGKEELSQREAVSSYLQTAMDASRRAADLTKQLLTLSRKQELRLAPVDINLSLKHIAKIMRNSFPKSIELDFAVGEQPLRVNADPIQIEQVILNLCVNASHAMTIMRREGERQGGKLAVNAELIRCDREFCILHPEAVKDSPYVKVRVSDTGVGMNDETLAQIFDPFFTTNKKDEGTGLGLAIAYSIVKLHRGFMDVYSEPGRGSTFLTYLPALIDGATGEPGSSAFDEIHRGSGNVLVIDDEEGLQRVARGMLEQCGYRVQCAGSGPEGIALFENDPSGIDAVLLDLSMPGMSGLETYERLRAVNPSVKILLTSGIIEDEQVRKAMERGIKGFIQKPYSAGDLSRKMKEILG
jgi:PAS domain S-box-containing protein